MEEKAPLLLTIAVLGGTGKEGKGLAYRWAKAGYKVLIGSRSPEKAVSAASEIIELLEGSSSVVGTTNLEAAQLANIVVLTVPYAAHRDTLESVKDVLKGKMLIDVTVPLMMPKTKVQMPAAGSAAQEAKEIVGEGVEVTVGRIEGPPKIDDDQFHKDKPKTPCEKIPGGPSDISFFRCVQKSRNPCQKDEHWCAEMSDPAGEKEPGGGCCQVGWRGIPGPLAEIHAYMVKRHDDDDDAAQ